MNVAFGNACWCKDWTRWLYHRSFGRNSTFPLAVITKMATAQPNSKTPSILPWRSDSWGYALSASHVPNIWADCKRSAWTDLATIFVLRNRHILLMHFPTITDSQFVGWRVAFSWPKLYSPSQKAPKERNCESFNVREELNSIANCSSTERGKKQWDASFQRWKLSQQKLLVNELQKSCW